MAECTARPDHNTPMPDLHQVRGKGKTGKTMCSGYRNV